MLRETALDGGQPRLINVWPNILAQHLKTECNRTAEMLTGKRYATTIQVIDRDRTALRDNNRLCTGCLNRAPMTHPFFDHEDVAEQMRDLRPKIREQN